MPNLAPRMDLHGGYEGIHTLPLASEQIKKAYDLQDKQVDKHAICMSMLIRIIILQFAWAHAREYI